MKSDLSSINFDGTPSFKEWINQRRYSIADFAALVLILGIVSIITSFLTTLLELVFD